MTRAWRALISVLFLVQSCGARDELEQLESTGSTSTGRAGGGHGGDGEGGAGLAGGLGGGGSAPGGSGPGGSGGSAGESCEGVRWVPPLAEVDEPDYVTTPAKLTHFGEDGGDVAVVYQRSPVEAPTSLTEMRHLGFRPWESWPSNGTLPQAFASYAHPDLAHEFAVGGGPEGKLGMLVGYGSTTSFSPRVDAHASDAGPSVSPAGAVARFVTRNGRMQLVGAADLEGRLHVTHVVESSVGFNTTRTALACASAPVVADAEPFEGGFLVASSNAAEADEGACAPGAGLPTQIDLYYVDEGGFVTFVGGFDAGGWVVDLETAAHSGGLSVVYTLQQFETIELQLVRFDLHAAAFAGPATIVSWEEQVASFAVTSFDDDLLVAYGKAAGWPPDLVVSRFDAAGTIVSSGTLVDPPSMADELSVVASPEARSAVVAGFSTEFPYRSRLARFDCL